MADAPTTYPVLTDPKSGAHWALVPGENVVGRASDATVRIEDLTISRRHFNVRHFGGQWIVEHLSASQPTLRNGRAIDGSTPLRHGDRLAAGDIEIVFLERAPDLAPDLAEDATLDRSPRGADATLRSGSAGRPDGTLRAGAITQAPEKPDSVIPLQPTTVMGRERERVTVCLPHPQVSRVHARIVREGTNWSISDLASANGTFVNNVRLVGPRVLQRGDRIKLGPYVFAFDGEALIAKPILGRAELACRRLSRTVAGPGGRPLTLLDGVDLVIRPGEFACIIGPSGSGKSTLLNALSARAPASSGIVEVNGMDLYANFDSLKGDLAVVPQRDVVHDTLTVRGALRYTARLRLPPDQSRAEMDARIDETLGQVTLSERADVVISRLSGGQLKRAVLANELVADPSVLFLDEVTSGLDEQTDREMMRLFRKVAESGKTVVCITHSLASIEATATLVVILAAGGRLAFVGTPAEAVTYFGVRTLGDVYESMAESTPDELKARFEAHPLHERYVRSRLHGDVTGGREAVKPPPPRPIVAITEGIRQWWILLERYMRLMTADMQAIATMAIQPLVVGAVLALVVGSLGELQTAEATIDAVETAGRNFDEIATARQDALAERQTLIGNVRAALFFLLVACFWFGCNNAAKEIVKERVIYLREQAVNLRPAAYYFSKLAVMGAISIAQMLLVLSIVRLFTGLPGSFATQAIMLGTLSIAGTALGLLLSTVSATEERAVAAVPLVLIPQVILSGAVLPLESTFAQALGNVLITCQWSYRSLAAGMPAEWVTELKASDWSMIWAWVMVVVHTVAFVALAVAILEIHARRLRLRHMLRALGGG